MLASNHLKALDGGEFDAQLAWLYGASQLEAQRARYRAAVERFAEIFGDRETVIVSAPGRTEVGGNHTDHQHGRVVAASVDMDILAVVSPVPEMDIQLQSEGYPLNQVDLSDLSIHQEEINKSNSLLRGVCARFAQLGYRIGGFRAYTTSNVLKGSGLSSSASFEVMAGMVLSELYNDGKLSPVEIAQIGQYAENVYFGKPSGLLDQTASAVGGFVAIDFADPSAPVVEQIALDVEKSGYALCIVDTGGSHADLTPDYAAVPAEMKAVAHELGCEFLRDASEEAFYSRIGQLRECCGDRAVLRAIHFFGENRRAGEQARLLKEGDFQGFLELVLASGRSSFMYLQNVYSPSSVSEQGISLALALCERLLAGKGAWRVHGGGFAGTVQAYVPAGMVEEFRRVMENAFGEGSCHQLRVRPCGAYVLKA